MGWPSEQDSISEAVTLTGKMGKYDLIGLLIAGSTECTSELCALLEGPSCPGRMDSV